MQEASWQEWLFSLLAHVRAEAAEVDVDIHTAAVLAQSEELISRFFQLVHVHAICHVKAGWRPVERTVNFLHMFSGRVRAVQILFNSLYLFVCLRRMRVQGAL